MTLSRGAVCGGAGYKYTSRDFVLSNFVRDFVYYKKPLDLKHKPQVRTRTRTRTPHQHLLRALHRLTQRAAATAVPLSRLVVAVVLITHTALHRTCSRWRAPSTSATP